MNVADKLLDNPLSPVIDVERLRTVLEHITANRRQFNQMTWGIRTPACGTMFCVAGWTVELAETHEVVWHTDGVGRAWTEFATIIETGESVHIREAGRKLLGFTREQTNVFFDTLSSLYRLWGYASRWTDGAIQRPKHVTPSGLRP